MASSRLEQSATIIDLRRKVRELQEMHNRLTTQVALLANELNKVKIHTEYRPPEESPEEIQKKRQMVEQFRHGTTAPAGRGGGGRPIRTIDN